jgi:hypothetical protein
MILTHLGVSIPPEYEKWFLEYRLMSLSPCACAPRQRRNSLADFIRSRYSWIYPSYVGVQWTWKFQLQKYEPFKWASKQNSDFIENASKNFR